MQRANKPTTPAGLALAFMSLTILPFSLSALGIKTDFSLGAAVAGLKQISSVLSSAYEPLASPVSNKPANPAQSETESQCSKMLSELGFEADVNALAALLPRAESGLARSS